MAGTGNDHSKVPLSNTHGQMGKGKKILDIADQTSKKKGK